MHLFPKSLAVALLGCAATISLAAQPASETSAKPSDPAARNLPAGAISQNQVINGSQEGQQPAPPLTPEELPAAPPQVRYQDGQLTIQSENSTLRDIILQVSKVTGAELETPPGFGTERVASRLGPGPASDVVSELLYGAKFGFVLVGAPDNPHLVQKILITKAASPAEAKNVTAGAAAPPAQPRNVAVAAAAAPVVAQKTTIGDAMAAAAPSPTSEYAPGAVGSSQSRLRRGRHGRSRRGGFQNVAASAESELVAEPPLPEIAQPEAAVEPPQQ